MFKYTYTHIHGLLGPGGREYLTQDQSEPFPVLFFFYTYTGTKKFVPLRQDQGPNGSLVSSHEKTGFNAVNTRPSILSQTHAGEFCVYALKCHPRSP